MDDERGFDQVMMNVRSTTGTVIASAMFTTKITLKLLTFLMRLAKKGLVATGFADRFKAFTKTTNGNYMVYNIPVTGERKESLIKLNELELALQNTKNPAEKAQIRNSLKKITKQMPEIEQLKKLGINYCVLPKLNGSDQTIQIAIDKKNDQMFKNWFVNHLTTEMSGGEKDMETLKVFTEGNYSIFNVPFEGEEVSEALQDWNTLGVNYTMLPDLKVGDDNSQIAVANVDRSKVEVWFKMWKEKQLQLGKQPGEMYEMNQESYLNTASMDAADYIKNSDPACQQVQKEYEAQSKKLPWEQGMDKENSESYVKLLQDDNYEKVTINKEKLVDGLKVSDKTQEMSRNGYFISRMPGTYGEKQQTLILPKEQVFTTDQEKTFVAFLPKNRPILVADAKGNIKEERFDVVYAPYDAVNRNMKKVKELQQSLSKKPDAPLPAMAVKPALPLPK